MKELDALIPDGFEDVLVEKSDIATANKSVGKECGLSSDLILKLNELGSSAKKQEPSKVIIVSNLLLLVWLFSSFPSLSSRFILYLQLREVAEPVKMQSVEVNVKKRKMDRHQVDYFSPVGFGGVLCAFECACIFSSTSQGY